MMNPLDLNLDHQLIEASAHGLIDHSCLEQIEQTEKIISEKNIKLICKYIFTSTYIVQIKFYIHIEGVNPVYCARYQTISRE